MRPSKWSINEVNSYLVNLGYVVINNNYKNVNTILTIKDNDGYLYSCTFSTILRGSYPWKICKSNPYTIQNIKLWCKLNNKPFELISDIYQNNETKLQWKCLKEDCKEIFELSWNNISNGANCNFCSGHQVGLSNCLATKTHNSQKNGIPLKTEI
jgi:hypothetical protein